MRESICHLGKVGIPNLLDLLHEIAKHVGRISCLPKEKLSFLTILGVIPCLPYANNNAIEFLYTNNFFARESL